MHQTFAQGRSVIHRIDPRPRVVTALAFAVVIAVSGRLPVPCAGLAGGILLAALARLRPALLLKRLAAVNVFLVLLWAFLPFTYPGEAAAHLWGLTATREGVLYALAITLKSNAIVLVVTALVSTIDVVRLGHTLSHLRVPDKLIHILLMTVRYLDLLRCEYLRLTDALKARAFRPRTNLHTYRTYGYLIGMLLLKSFDRSERVLAAMKCRGWSGRFHVLAHFALARRDLVFTFAAALALLALGWMEWVPTDL